LEFQNDPESKIVRPRQNYKGKMNLDYVDFEKREEVNNYFKVQILANNGIGIY
jgi:hypothetical protein